MLVDESESLCIEEKRHPFSAGRKVFYSLFTKSGFKKQIRDDRIILPFTLDDLYEKKDWNIGDSVRRESNPHLQLGRLR